MRKQRINEHHERIIRLFQSWYADTAASFALPLRIRSKRDYGIITILGVTRGIRVRMRADSIAVYANHRRRNYDCIYDSDIAPRQDARGWYCEWCAEESRMYYQTEAELYIAHQFEPFRGWINETLTAASFIAYHGRAGRTSTWAVLEPAGAVAKSRPGRGLWAVKRRPVLAKRSSPVSFRLSNQSFI